MLNDIIYDVNTRSVAPISDWSKSIKGEKCSEIDRVADWLCENRPRIGQSSTSASLLGAPSTCGWTATRSLMRCMPRLMPTASISARMRIGICRPLTLDKILYYTCARCGIAKLSANISREPCQLRQERMQRLFERRRQADGRPAGRSSVRYCARCHQKLTKEN